MTEKSRRHHIEQALVQVRESTGLKETITVPLRGGTLLEVIEIPLDIPVLNANSFRIAPQLLDHPDVEAVRADPFSPTSQAVIADLVRTVHRNVKQLKENLLDEGQQTPGVITRDGVLINANTRCVLLRDLAVEGRLSRKTLRVAVLPGVVTEKELLELEMLLQQQVELKDEYRLISGLMMVKKLHDIGISDEEIGRRQRLRKARGRSAAQRVAEKRAILMLMERARRLVEPHLPLTAFDSEEDKYENWRDLHNAVDTLDRTEGPAAGDDHIRRWMIAYFTGVDSVHGLRPLHNSTDWVTELLIPELRENPQVARAVEELKPTGEQRPPTADGLDLLGDPPAPATTSTEVGAVLNVVLAAKAAESGEPVQLPSGKEVSAPDVRDSVRAGVEKAVNALRRAEQAGDRLHRPRNEIGRALTALNDASDAIDAAKRHPDFAASVDDLRVLVDEVDAALAQVRTKLADASVAGGE